MPPRTMPRPARMALSAGAGRMIGSLLSQVCRFPSFLSPVSALTLVWARLRIGVSAVSFSSACRFPQCGEAVGARGLGDPAGVMPRSRYARRSSCCRPHYLTIGWQRYETWFSGAR